MKNILVILIILLTAFSSHAQISERNISHYSSLLGKRNARLIGCDSVAPYLEAVYKKILTEILYYRNSPQTFSNKRRLLLSYKLLQNDLYTVLAKKERIRYKRLSKIKGNIFLL